MVKIEIDTTEVSRTSAHQILDAAYGALSPSCEVAEEPKPVVVYDEARALRDASSSPGWRALIHSLEQDGRAEVAEVAAAAGLTTQGVLIAIGRAVKGDYKRNPWSWQWSGHGAEQVCTIDSSLQAALQVESVDKNFFDLDS